MTGVTLIRLLATHPRITGPVLAQLATQVTPASDEAALLAAHHNTSDEDCERAWPATDKPFHHVQALRTALGSPTSTPSTVSRVLDRTANTALALLVRRDHPVHPAALTELANRTLTLANAPDGPHLPTAIELLKHPNLPTPALRHALLALVTTTDAAGATSPVAVTWAATGDPEVLCEVAHAHQSRDLQGQDRFADLVHYANLSRTGHDPRQAMRANLAEYGRTQPLLWPAVIAQTGDLELATLAWADRPGDREIANAIVEHPHLAGTDLAWQAHHARVTYPGLAPVPVPEAPAGKLPDLAATLTSINDLYLLLERLDTPAEALEVLGHRLTADPHTTDPWQNHPDVWEPMVTMAAVHPACPTHTRADLHHAWQRWHNPNSDKVAHRRALLELATWHLPHDPTTAGLHLPLPEVSATLPAMLTKWVHAAFDHHPAVLTDPDTATTAVALWDKFPGTLGELLTTASTITT